MNTKKDCLVMSYEVGPGPMILSVFNLIDFPITHVGGFVTFDVYF